MTGRRLLGIAGLCCIILPGCDGNQNNETDLEPSLPPPEEWMDLGTLESTYNLVNDLSIHALVSTEGAPQDAPTIVLVHGSGLSGQYMIPTARKLSPYFRVYVPDIPGYGDSGDPGEILGVPEMAEWLVDWMEVIGLEQASFLGNSFGCQVIADIAARYPERVEAALLQGPTTPPAERSAFWQFVRWRQNQPYNPEWLADITDEDYEKAGAVRLVRSFMFQLTDRIEDKAPMIEAPTLVMRGELDPITRQDFSEMLVDRLPRGRLHIIPDEAHTLVFTSPEPIVEATRAFLAELDTAGPGDEESLLHE